MKVILLPDKLPQECKRRMKLATKLYGPGSVFVFVDEVDAPLTAERWCTTRSDGLRSHVYKSEFCFEKEQDGIDFPTKAAAEGYLASIRMPRYVGGTLGVYACKGGAHWHLGVKA